MRLTEKKLYIIVPLCLLSSILSKYLLIPGLILAFLLIQKINTRLKARDDLILLLGEVPLNKLPELHTPDWHREVGKVKRLKDVYSDTESEETFDMILTVIVMNTVAKFVNEKILKEKEGAEPDMAQSFLVIIMVSTTLEEVGLKPLFCFAQPKSSNSIPKIQ